jgi:serine phosphatase RsbU (regulator of sigma subunit)
MNIYSKLTLLCLFLVIVTGSILFFFTNQKFKKAFREEITASVQQQSKEAIKNIDRFIYSRLKDVSQTAANPYYTDMDLPQETLVQRLQELEKINDLFYSFSIFDLDRIRIADSKRLSLGKQHGNRLYWQVLNPDNPLIMDISRSESLGKVVMHFTTYIYDENRNPKGVLVGRILIDELYNVLGNFALTGDKSRKLNVNLIDQNGLILYSNKFPEAVLKNTYDEYEMISASTEEQAFYEADDQLYFVFEEQGYRSFAGNNWKLVLSISKEDAYIPVKDIQSELTWVIIPVLIGSILLALVAANIFVSPIIKLSDYASEIGKGNLKARVDIKSNDEIGNLAKQLTKTSQFLIKRIDDQRKLNRRLEEQRRKMLKQREMLQDVNKQIRDSIYYAERIQKSLQPDTKVIRRNLKDAMVLFKPKDIVSGDFYWFERIRWGRHDYLVIAAADCTGHGVPGAIMGIMGSNQLTHIVYYQNILDPRKILARLDKTIKIELYREDIDTVKKDGMEIGVCVINLDEYAMEFAGMGLPLYLVRNGSIQVYKSPRLMAGGTDGDEKQVEGLLKSERIQLEKRDKLYLASDGFQDQFGGDEDKKYMTKNFRNLLERTSTENMKRQRELLEEEFDRWKGNYPQTDDIVVVGFEV